MNSLRLNSVKNVSFASANSPSFLSNVFGSYLTLALTSLLLIAVTAGVFIYFKTIGYTIDMGWDKLWNVFKQKEEITVSLTEDDKEASSTKLLPPESEHEGTETSKLKSLLGIDQSKDSGGIDVGYPPSSEHSLPFTPEERPSGMPGAKEQPGFLSRAMDRFSRKDMEVFNVSRNLYTYDEAAPLCKALGAELATYEDIVDAQKNGADWCNYGWTKGQMAVFPTSDQTWNKLQSGDSRYRNSCGKPGVNGGFFDNPELRFGVNCYGKRPVKKDTDELLTDSDLIVPPTAEQIEFEKKVEKFRDNIGNINILPWNRGAWNGQ
jgi:hypothetical protein